jgi:hypothetical protein
VRADLATTSLVVGARPASNNSSLPTLKQLSSNQRHRRARLLYRLSMRLTVLVDDGPIVIGQCDVDIKELSQSLVGPLTSNDPMTYRANCYTQG